MAQKIRVTGRAPGGEARPIAQLTMEVSFQLSDYPDENWKAAFGRAVGKLTADPMHANVHPMLMGDKIRVQCATTILGERRKRPEGRIRSTGQHACR